MRVDNHLKTVDKPPSGGRNEPLLVDKRPVRGASISDIWRVPRDVWRARRALDSGDLAGARALVGPLLDRFGGVTLGREVAPGVLYASGDPLSAASLFEQVAQKLPKGPAVVRW